MRAKFGIFKISQSGADSLYTARDRKGRPLTAYAKAVAEKNWILTHNPTLNIIVRSI